MKTVKRAAALLLALILLAGYGGSVGCAAPAEKEEELPVLLLPEASGKAVQKNTRAEIDYSNTADGYVMARFTASTDQAAEGPDHRPLHHLQLRPARRELGHLSPLRRRRAVQGNGGGKHHRHQVRRGGQRLLPGEADGRVRPPSSGPTSTWTTARPPTA